MLVALRELSKEEIVPPSSGAAGTPVDGSAERLYSLYSNETSATVVDVTDGRARKTFNLDVRVSTNTQLFDVVVRPMLETVLAPDGAAQVVVVADGTRVAREAVLFGRAQDFEDGLVVTALRDIRTRANVAAVFIGGVTQDDHNRLHDLFAPPEAFADPSAPAPEPTILEDTKDHFTAVEEASYQEVRDDAHAIQLAGMLKESLSDTKHQIIPVIIAFDEASQLPNATVQFVSLCVNEMARSMKSTRHCVSTAASLLECRSPVMPFNGTRVSFLLKPPLLGMQPGAWVSCMSPMSFVPAAPSVDGRQQTPGIPLRETFKEAFSVAQMASRIYSSRIGVTNPSLPRVVKGTQEVRSEGRPPVAVAAPRSNAGDPGGMESTTPSDALLSSGHTPDAFQQDSITATDTDLSGTAQARPRPHGGASADGLMDTPHPTRLATTGPPQQHEHDHLPMGAPVRDRPSQTPGAAKMSGNNEPDAFKAAMQEATSALRGDVREYARRLDETRAELERERARAEALRHDYDRLLTAHSNSAKESAAAQGAAAANEEHGRLREEINRLRTDLAAAHSTFHERLAKTQAEARSAQLRLTAEMGTALTQLSQSREEHHMNASNATTEEVTILKARVSELMELVTFHQGEIQGHVDTEKAYRERILSLELALRDARAENRSLAQEIRGADERARAAKTQLNDASARQRATQDALNARQSQQEQELAKLQDTVGSLTERLQEALGLAERERSQRAALEERFEQQRNAAREEEARAADRQRLRESQWEDQGRRDTESQLAAMQAELKELKAHLAQQSAAPHRRENSTGGIQVLSTSTVRRHEAHKPRVDAFDDVSDPAVARRSVRAALPPPTPPATSKERQAAAQGKPPDDVSTLSNRSISTHPESTRDRRRRLQHHRSRSFEDFMQEDSVYQLRQHVPMSAQPRTSRFRL